MQYLIGSIAVSLIIAGMSAYILNAEPYESSPSLNFLCNKALFVFSNLLPVQTILMAGVIVTAVTSTWRLRVKKVLWKDWISFYLLILLAGFWLAFILFPASLPRYTGFGS